MADDSSFDGTERPVDAPLPDIFEARITGTPDTIARVLREFELDVGCRHAHLETNADGTVTVLVYATADRVRELQAAGYRVAQGENVSALGRGRQAEVGKGDRFEGGRQAPKGLARKPGRGKNGGAGV